MRVVTNSLILATGICVGLILGLHGVRNPLANIAIKTSLCSSLFGAVLIIAFALTTFLEGIRLRVHSQALAYGLLFYFSGKLVVLLAIVFGGSSSWTPLQEIVKPLYVVCLFVWSVLLWFDEPKRVLSTEMDKIRQAFEVFSQKHDSGVAVAARSRPALKTKRRLGAGLHEVRRSNGDASSES